MGKGSKERPVDRKKFRKNWDAIFGEAQDVEFGDERLIEMPTSFDQLPDSLARQIVEDN